ncbi:MAG TPA: hypothetical protein PLR25_11585, partial [Planctomycetaceae bacterium]|nr:hypothetical protein [Planctomycetaceae bacterium]
SKSASNNYMPLFVRGCLRRQICPQICFLWRGSVARVRSPRGLADEKAQRRELVSIRGLPVDEK